MNDDRLREQPEKRFAGPEHLMDLDREVEALLAEPRPEIRKHRQKALYKHGPVSINLFAFEQGGGLKEHVVRNGSVAIHVLEGALTVNTATAEHEMKRGSLLILASGVVHGVLASQPTQMLLTVHLDDPG